MSQPHQTSLNCQIPLIKGGFLHQWFADYAKAKSCLKQGGGFLFPYQNQFFICDTGYIQDLGLDPNDPDWKLIGHDWVNPDDKEARERLYRKWLEKQKFPRG
jgi:hypothetical protein